MAAGGSAPLDGAVIASVTAPRAASQSAGPIIESLVLPAPWTYTTAGRRAVPGGTARKASTVSSPAVYETS